jgi:hypothetical protein
VTDLPGFSERLNCICKLYLPSLIGWSRGTFFIAHGASSVLDSVCHSLAALSAYSSSFCFIYVEFIDPSVFGIVVELTASIAASESCLEDAI